MSLHKRSVARLVTVFLGCLLVTQISCVTVTDRTVSSPSIQRETNVTSQGTPETQLTIHPDHQGWTVHLTQPLLRHVEIVRTERKKQHAYYPNPYAMPAGPFACPSSVWGWF